MEPYPSLDAAPCRRAAYRGAVFVRRITGAGMSDDRLTLLMLTILAVGLFGLGTACGWCARTVATYDTYIRALAEKHVADQQYWSRRSAQIINDNELERKKRNGTSKN